MLKKAETAILVIGNYRERIDDDLMTFNETYIIAGDGSSKTQATITAPSVDYTHDSAYTIVKGVLHIFGGMSDRNKVQKRFFCIILFHEIAKLEGCEFVELAARMTFSVSLGSSALAIEQQNEGTRV